MNYKAHLFASIFVFFIFLSILKYLGIVFSLKELVFLLFCSVLGGLIPDIDTRKSKINKIFSAALIIIALSIIVNSTKIEEVFCGLALIFIVLLLKKFPKHRKFFHSLKFGILASIFIGIISEFYFNSFLPAFFFFLGFFSHLVLDKIV